MSGAANPAGVALARVVVGLDGSPAALEAGRQVPRVVGPDAKVWTVSCWDPATAMHAGIHAGAVARDLRDRSVEALNDGDRELHPLESVLVKGSGTAGLLSVAQEREADLIAIGAAGLHGTLGLVTGSVASAMCRHAPCSVLVAMPMSPNCERGPVVIASDGSVGAMIAAATAGRIAAREGLPLIVACVGDEAGCAAAVEEAGVDGATERVLSGSVPDAITQLAREENASLIVVGARGRRGIKTLGSVSRRVADSAPCSTLIVRPRSYPSVDLD